MVVQSAEAQEDFGAPKTTPPRLVDSHPLKQPFIYYAVSLSQCLPKEVKFDDFCGALVTLHFQGLWPVIIACRQGGHVFTISPYEGLGIMYEHVLRTVIFGHFPHFQ